MTCLESHDDMSWRGKMPRLQDWSLSPVRGEQDVSPTEGELFSFSNRF